MELTAACNSCALGGAGLAALTTELDPALGAGEVSFSPELTGSGTGAEVPVPDANRLGELPSEVMLLMMRSPSFSVRSPLRTHGCKRHSLLPAD